MILLLIQLLLTTSCKKEEDEPPNDEPQKTEEQINNERGRDVLNVIMNEWYYWYDMMPQVNPIDYDNPYALLEALRYLPVDVWSFVTDYQSFIDYYSGSFAGHGIRIGLDNQGQARIAMIYSSSPLYAEPHNVRRGWIIDAVNGTDIAALLIAGNFSAYQSVMGPPEPGITNQFDFIKPDGTEVTISSTKTEFQANSVMTHDTLHIGGSVAGYLVLESFIEPTSDELEEAFSFFHSAGIDDLILDLRYNSGGMLNVATELASYLAGNEREDLVFIKSEHNNKKSFENEITRFHITAHSIGLSRLIVITTGETASASENIINGLSPYMDVVTIGDTTSGKPTGMYAFVDAPHNKFIFAPTTFKLVNSEGVGDYFNGIAPTISAHDDITRDFGNREELSLKAAIEYLEGAKRSIPDPAAARAVWIGQERPLWQNNLFINREVVISDR